MSEETTLTLPIPKQRQFFLDDDVDQTSVGSIVKKIVEVNDDDAHLVKLYSVYGMTYQPKPITLYISSYGGDLYTCLGFISFMKANPTPIHTVVTGVAISAGFLIAIAGARRFCYKNTTYMLHQLSFNSSGESSTTLKNAASEATEGLRLQKIAENHVLDHSKISKKKLKSIYDTQTDTYFDSEEALKLFLVDEIIGVEQNIDKVQETP